MATIVHKTINGYGPYAYRVTYVGNGKQNWEYLGKVGASTPPEGPLTNGGDRYNDEELDEIAGKDMQEQRTGNSGTSVTEGTVNDAINEFAAVTPGKVTDVKETVDPDALGDKVDGDPTPLLNAVTDRGVYRGAARREDLRETLEENVESLAPDSDTTRTRHTSPRAGMDPNDVSTEVTNDREYPSVEEMEAAFVEYVEELQAEENDE